MSGNSRRACAMPTGSCARTFAPMSRSPVTSGIDGASRMSSVSGLKVRPSTAMVLPRRLPPAALAVVVDRQHRLDDPKLHVMVERDLDQRASVFRETRAPKTRPGVEEFRA